jgi:hypothetical protein
MNKAGRELMVLPCGRDRRVIERSPRTVTPWMTGVPDYRPPYEIVELLAHLVDHARMGNQQAAGYLQMLVQPQ